MDVSQRTLDVLPAFADRENRELDASVQALMASLKLTSADVAAQRARGAAMVDHLRHVQLELAGSQLRRDARVKELATEDHMRRLNAGEAVCLGACNSPSSRVQQREHQHRMPSHHISPGSLISSLRQRTLKSSLCLPEDTESLRRQPAFHGRRGWIGQRGTARPSGKHCAAARLPWRRTRRARSPPAARQHSVSRSLVDQTLCLGRTH